MYMSSGGEKGDDPWLEVSLSGCKPCDGCHDGAWPMEVGRLVEDEVGVDSGGVGSEAK
jgi:hypothetical protein